MQTEGPECSAMSLLTPIGYNAGDCGYCKAEDSSQRTPNSRGAYYAKSESLCPTHYQVLVDRGFRRSGTLLYLPDVMRSCCPHYTIRLPAVDFKPSRDQRQALNRWHRFVLGERYLQEVEKKYPKSKAQKKQDNTTFDLLTNIHSSESANLKPDIEPDHKLVVTLEPDTYTEEKFALFSNYQRHVHHETDSDISKQGFKRFLCNSPLHRQTTSSGLKLGSYHQCYRLDGRLIAMGVLDLLPHAVSGVYFLYHSDYEKWSFGKLSALREAGLALEDGYQYYYMGYYIHSCRKMRYKGDYRPQYVLDFNSHEWEPLGDEVKGLMEERRYPRPPGSKHADVAGARNEGSRDVQAIKYPNPVAAVQSDLSVVELGMPGVEPLDEILDKVDINSMRLTIGGGRTHQMRDLMSWDSEGQATEPGTLKAVIAEFTAAIGPEVAKGVTVGLKSVSAACSGRNVRAVGRESFASCEAHGRHEVFRQCERLDGSESRELDDETDAALK